MNSNRSVDGKWEKLRWHPVGGVYQAGFGAGKDLIIVHTSNGLGLFDTLTGERIGRDYDVVLPHEQCITCAVPGFGALDGEMVRMAGIWGGGLRLSTLDDCHLGRDSSHWPYERVMITLSDRRKEEVEDNGEGEFRAYGFSDTGRSFVVVTSSSLNIYRRAEALSGLRQDSR